MGRNLTYDGIVERLKASAGHNDKCGDGLQVYGTIELPKFKFMNGQRHTKKRFDRFSITREDIEGKTILDLGCNIGCLTFECVNLGCKLSHGIDYAEPRIEIARDIAEFAGVKNVTFAHGNLDKMNVIGEYDVVFCLALDGWVQNKRRLYEILGRVTKETLYFETHIGAGQGSKGKPENEKVKKILTGVGFKHIEYVDKPQTDTNPGRQQFRPNYIARK